MGGRDQKRAWFFRSWDSKICSGNFTLYLWLLNTEDPVCTLVYELSRNLIHFQKVSQFAVASLPVESFKKGPLFYTGIKDRKWIEFAILLDFFRGERWKGLYPIWIKPAILTSFCLYRCVEEFVETLDNAKRI